MPGIGHGDLGLAQGRLGLLEILLGRDAGLPQPALALVRGLGRFQAALGGEQLAALVGQGCLGRGAAKLIKLVTTESAPRVAFETKKIEI